MHACYAMLCAAAAAATPPSFDGPYLSLGAAVRSFDSQPNPNPTLRQASRSPPIPSHPIPSRGPRALPLPPPHPAYVSVVAR